MFCHEVLLIFAALVIFYVECASSIDESGIKPFLGIQYKLHSRDENFPEVLKGLGANDREIEKAKQNKPHIQLTFKDDKYTLKRNGGGFGDFEYTFKMNEEFSTMSHTSIIKMKFTVEGDTLTQGIIMNTGSPATLVYHFSKQQLKVVGEVYGIKTTEIYEK